MMLKRGSRILLVSIFVVWAAIGLSYGQTAAGAAKNLGPADIDRIIKKFTANEREFRQALASYAFKRNVMFHTIGLGGQITGTYRRDSHMTLNTAGERFEKILFAPVASVPPGTVTAEDLEDLGGVNAFALEPRSIDQYNFAYVGTERIDELSLYVFDVTPKSIPDPSKKIRLFTGRIWVDVDDLMIVKSKGKGVPETKINKFPVVETTRTQVDGKYWFPADARSDDELVFDNGEVMKIRLRIKYTDYSVGRSEVRILDDDEPVPTPSPTPKKPE
ncbi:MAG TPA: hypothetical protein VNA17_04470 [Pyrinomonadaceae bacterium]|nr:hypothetical protein [Pyrinomonadaceae bacterium]